MIKFICKNFSSQLPKKLVNLNGLNKHLKNTFEKATSSDLIDVMNKFQELAPNDQNANLKLYDILDYILYEPKHLKDNILLKTVMRTMLSVKINDKVYWDHFKQIILKNNMLFNEEENFIEYMKFFAIVKYDDEEIWKVFEEYFLEMNGSFDLEQLQTIALCFGNNEKGSKQFWVSLFERHDLKNQVYYEFILNFTISICGYLPSKKLTKINEKIIEYFCEYLNFSSDYLNKLILQGTSTDKIDLVYSLFPHFLKSYHNDKLHIQYSNNIEKDIYKNLLDTLENYLKTYLELNFKKLENVDYEQISKILKYSIDNRHSLGKMKASLFSKIFISDYENIKNPLDILNFLNYFKISNLREEKLRNLLDKDTIWEIFLDHMHLMTLDELINLTSVAKFYQVSYTRLWIFLQNFFKMHVQKILKLTESQEYRGEYLKQIDKIIFIFDEESFKYQDYILHTFLVFLQTSRNKLNLIESYKIKV
jgi:hypothetical protein